MAKTLVFRNATTTNLSSTVGTLGELFVDITKNTVVVMDGVTAGGIPLATESFASSNIYTLSSNTATNIANLSSVAATKATTTSFGIVRADGTSINVGAGVLFAAVSSNGFGVRTISTSGPVGGNDGDIWYQV